jgi:TolA-binding protein
MAFDRRWLLMVFALVLGAGQLFAATTREDRAYAAALSAFQDGMWNRAETELVKFIQKHPDSDRVARAVLLQAEAEYWQGKLPEAIALLTARKAGAGDLADQYVYWMGEAQFQAGDLPAAAETFVSLTRDFPQSSLRLRAVVEAAAVRARLAEWPQLTALLEPTNSVFQRAMQMDPANELVTRGTLLLAQARFAQNDLRGAAATLESLNPQTLQPDLGWQREYLLYRVRLAAGDTNAALAATANLVQIAQSKKDEALQAQGVILRAQVLEQLGQKPAAIAAYAEILALNAPEVQQQAILKMAELAIAQNQFSDAEQSLERFLPQFRGSAATDVALLALGELHLQDYIRQPAATNQLAAARTRFDQFLRMQTNSPYAGKAYLDRGWCSWLAGNTTNSLADFEAAAQRRLPPEDLAVARFKMGDALFALTNYSGALDNYRRVVDDFTNVPAVMQTLGDQALYQMLRANLELTNVDGAADVLDRLLKLYPASELAGKSLLLVGEGMADASKPAAARALFQRFVDESPTNALRPQVELAMARTY